MKKIKKIQLLDLIKVFEKMLKTDNINEKVWEHLTLSKLYSLMDSEGGHVEVVQEDLQPCHAWLGYFISKNEDECSYDIFSLIYKNKTVLEIESDL